MSIHALTGQYNSGVTEYRTPFLDAWAKAKPNGPKKGTKTGGCRSTDKGRVYATLSEISERREVEQDANEFFYMLLLFVIQYSIVGNGIWQ